MKDTIRVFAEIFENPKILTIVFFILALQICVPYLFFGWAIYTYMPGLFTRLDVVIQNTEVLIRNSH